MDYGLYGDFCITYPKPYSIYLRGIMVQEVEVCMGRGIWVGLSWGGGEFQCSLCVPARNPEAYASVDRAIPTLT